MDERNKHCWLLNNCNHCDCDHFCYRLYKLDYLYNNANISLKQREYLPLRVDANGNDSEAFMKLKEIENNIVDFVNKGENLYIHSQNAGNGKTSWCLRLIQSYFNKIWVKCNLECKGLFINVPMFLLELKNNITNKSDYIEQIKENVLKCDIVIWDDIGTKAITPFESENLFSIIDSRISSGKSNLFTSNLNDDELHKALGDRLYSRIANYSLNIELVGADKRGIK